MLPWSGVTISSRFFDGSALSSAALGVPWCTLEVLPFSLRVDYMLLDERLLPNKRLKLAGAYRSSGTGVLRPGGRGRSSTTLAPAGESPAA